ncbi:MAG: hypothetical protein WC939_02950 [Acholeplasmataceae bacterium]
MNKSLARAKVGSVKTKAPDGTEVWEELNQVPYDNRRMKEVVETLFNEIKSLKDEVSKIKVDRDEFYKKYQELQIEHDRMLVDVKSLKTFTLD